MNVSKVGEPARFEPMPYFYAPLLQGSPYHPITKNLMPVKSDFPSVLEVVNNDPLIKKEYLLISSNASHVTTAPGGIVLQEMMELDPQSYFNTGFLPVAIIMEGKFPSVFTHRMVPKGVKAGKSQEFSDATRMVVVADGDLIRNEFERSEGGYRVLPAGYDRLSRQVYGNKDFALNALLYLTDESGLMQLRNRQMPLRLLNKAAVVSHKGFWQWISVAGPLLLLALFALFYLLWRKRKYSK